MWPFSHKYSLAECGIFKDFIECHCHLLPGVDDGVREMGETLKLFSEYENAGFSEVWLTPHIMEDVPNTTEELRQRFEALKSEYHGSLQLHLASENMMDNLFEERMNAKDFLPEGPDGRFLLVETSYFNPPIGLDEKLESIKSAGYFPLLAHPERYLYMKKADYKPLKDKGIYFQLNLYSLVGAYGEDALEKSRWMLSEGMYDMAGTDTHSLRAFMHFTAKPMLRRSDVDLLLSSGLNKNLKI